MKSIITTALIPAAGLGTRMLSISKSAPKEILPIAGKPMIQYLLDEIEQTGIKEVAVVISKKKDIIRSYVLKNARAKPTFIYQPSPLGVADAIHRARGFVGSKPFMVLLPDNIFFSKIPAALQLARAFKRYKRDIHCLMRVSRKDAHLFGNCGKIKLRKVREENDQKQQPSLPGSAEGRTKLFYIQKLYSKKRGCFSTGRANWTLRTFARTIYLPHVFDYIEKVKKITTQGELDDVPVIQEMIKGGLFLGCLLDGKGFDAGTPAGYYAANQFVSRHCGEPKADCFARHCEGRRPEAISRTGSQQAAQSPEIASLRSQ